MIGKAPQVNNLIEFAAVGREIPEKPAKMPAVQVKRRFCRKVLRQAICAILRSELPCQGREGLEGRNVAVGNLPLADHVGDLDAG